MQIKSQVTATPAADSASAIAHFESRLGFETDCWDVQHGIENEVADYVLLDVRSPELYAAGHVPTAVNLPGNRVRAETLPALEGKKLYVVYCAGPHCNGANRAALKIANLGLPVKEMIGGVTGWLDEGFDLIRE